MNELKELCDRMVADAPPMPDGTTVLASARRSAARRRLALGAAASVVVLAAAALTVPSFLSLGPVGGAPASVGASSPGPEEALSPYEKRMADLARSAMPAGYTATVGEQAFVRPHAVGGSSDPPVDEAFVSVVIADGHGLGALTAAAYWPINGENFLLSCENRSPDVQCESVTVNGVRVTVTTGADRQGRTIEAFRPAGSGYVWITVHQVAVFGGAGSALPTIGPGLAGFPFTTEWIAALAADPGMVPPA